MSEARYLVGDVFDRMAELPDGSVDLIVTSPPFLALRSYIPADHPDKHKEIGSEATPADFLSTLLALTREWRRVLAPHGSLCVELGDTYAGSGGAGGDWIEGSGQRVYTRGSEIPDFSAMPPRKGSGWPLDKSLCLLPTLYPASLAYGRNLLTGEPCEPWRVRNLIVWHRPNPPVGALGDKVRPSTSYITVACTSRTRWFDLDAERGPGSPNTHARLAQGVQSRPTSGKKADNPNNNYGSMAEVETAGAPPLDCWIEDRLAQSDEPIDTTEPDVWTLSTQPYKGSHYATFPVTLPRKLINLMCPRQVCVTCGEPRRRIVESLNGGTIANHDLDNMRGLSQPNPRPEAERFAAITTLGWSDCGHNTWRRGLVLDPFAGSGTTLVAASELGRDSIGIDIDERNHELARERCGMFLVENDEVVA